MSAVLAPATADDLRLIWPGVSAAHLFDDFARLTAVREAAPWSIRVNRAGEAVVLGRWREHLDLLAVRGIWCSTARIPVLLEDLRAVAREQGFGRLLGPLVPEDSVAPYLAAGLAVRQRIVVYRIQPPSAPAAPPPGVTLRLGSRDDLAGVAAVDAACFDDFWRYDPAHLADALASERLVLALTGAGQVIGYTLSTVHGVEGTVGRLAVVAPHRRSGVGAALLADAVSAAARRGVAGMTLCTQEENTASRRLYERAGFRRSPGCLVSTISNPLA